MKGFHLIIPAAGKGVRFSNEGYSIPKPLIEIHGKPFFFWAVQSICKWAKPLSLTFVVLEEHIKDFHIDQRMRHFFPECRIVSLQEVTPGPVFTCLAGAEGIPDDETIVFNDCDHLFVSRELISFLTKGDSAFFSGLAFFESDNPAFSYVTFDSNGRVAGTVEKQVVSRYAICGTYVFKDFKLFKEAFSTYVSSCPYSEFFMSGIYNVLCSNGIPVRVFKCDSHVSFGTPKEFHEAKNSSEFSLLE